MNSPDREWWTEQSGEYVLGTLSDAEWVTFKKAAEHNSEAQQLIVKWEQFFQPLADSLKPVEPPGTVWKAVDARIATVVSSTDSANVVTLAKYKSRTRSLETKLNRWRSYAGFATAASVLLGTLAWVTRTEIQNQPPIEPIASVSAFDSIAIIRDEQSLPLWVVDASLEDGLVRVTAIAPPVIDSSKSYQLWIVKPDDAGVQSMGLIPSVSDKSLILNVQQEAEQPIAFAVSLEEFGGSTLDVPTGPVLYQGVIQELSL